MFVFRLDAALAPGQGSSPQHYHKPTCHNPTVFAVPQYHPLGSHPVRCSIPLNHLHARLASVPCVHAFLLRVHERLVCR